MNIRNFKYLYLYEKIGQMKKLASNSSRSQYRTKNQRLDHDEFFFKYFAALELEEEPRSRHIGKRTNYAFMKSNISMDRDSGPVPSKMPSSSSMVMSVSCGAAFLWCSFAFLYFEGGRYTCPQRSPEQAS